MYLAKAYKHRLVFKQASGTSRGVLKVKDSWYIKIWNKKNPQIFGIGECGLLKGLSCDDVPHYESQLEEVCVAINDYIKDYPSLLKKFPSIRFGVEMALLDLKNLGKRFFFKSCFTDKTAGIPINGLIWMGNEEFLKKQIKAKIESGFKCIKMKIGAIDFDTEYSILKSLREEFSQQSIEIRVDANGAFSTKDALHKLKLLSKLHIHSIEQPIKAGQWEQMSKLCKHSPLAIALDEELIGIHDLSSKIALLEQIKPQYIILKPSLIGGFQASEEWIKIAQARQINWWATSALESNIGLNAIAQWTASMNTKMYQGLGTGGLYTNNIKANLEINRGHIFLNKDSFDLELFE